MKTILVADDEDFLRLLVKETLDRYRVLEARDGDEAIVIAREARPDLLILDWMMPGSDGLLVLDALRADSRTREIPVLMVTAKLGASERAQLLARGANACLAKPYSTAVLRESVEAILSGGAEPV